MIEKTFLSELKKLEYCEITGNLIWVKSKKVAGWISERGYRRVRINGRLRMAHHIVWAIKTGFLPELEIDHIDGNKLNNRFENLRVATRSINTQNIKTSQKKQHDWISWS